MLESIKIRNFALLENALMETGPGLNVITGETGAGKSILIGALSMALGERVGREIVRAGEKLCEVEAVFGSPSSGKITEFMSGLELGTDELVIRRVFDPAGRSRCYINDRSVTLATLCALGDMLVDIHSQNQHQALLDSARQMELLDDYGGLKKLLDEASEDWRRCTELADEKAKLLERREKTMQESERLRYEIAEIDSAALRPGIEEDIEAEFRILNNSETLCGGTADLYLRLYESDGSVFEALSAACNKAAELSGIDSSLKQIEESISKALIEIEAASGFLRNHTESDFRSPGRLEELLEMKDLLGTLKRKYGPAIDDVISYRGEIGRCLEEYDTSTEKLEQLENEILSSRACYDKAASELLKKRKTAAAKLSGDVNGRLSFLGMSGADFQALAEAAPPGASGGSKIRFVIKTNPGNPKMDLKKIASGGEVSRIMLAVKSALAGADDVPVLVFDEIDTGIGADTAGAVAEELKRLAAYHMVISITHLPQIAGRADVHLKVRKDTEKESTVTVIERLDAEGRIKELARMLGGENEKIPLKHARELLKKNE